jgi:L-alanine-DL-glutamate epimerase-like enolase superfamily enzyme
MIITKIELSYHQIALKHPFVTALRRVENMEFIRVKIYTDSLHVGIGEAPATKAVTGESIESIQEDIREDISPKIVGLSLQKAFNTILTCKQNSASAAIDMALFTLSAKEKNLSLKEYLGAKTDKLKTAITISLDTPQMMALRAKEALERGLDILKVKVGAEDGRDSKRIEAVRRVSSDATILVDANQAWSLDEALEIIENISHLNISLIEQPLIAHDLDAMAELTCKSKIPILADESAFNLKEVKKVIEKKAAHMINIKLMKCGGVSSAIEIIKYCQKHNFTCMMGSMLESPASIKAAASLAMAYPQTIKYIDLDSPLLYEDIKEAEDICFNANELSL